MRIENEFAYVLETRPYRETSLLLEALTAEHGRIALVARGVRGESRSQRQRRATLEPFQRLGIGFSGRGEVLSLTAVECLGGPVRPVGIALFAALYVNELIYRLTGRGDPVPGVFRRYTDWLGELEQQPTGDLLAWSLRRFERDLLAELGYALALDHEIESGEPVQAEGEYGFDPEQGAVRWQTGLPWPKVQGATLMAWAGEPLPDATTSLALKRLARSVIRHHLGGVEPRAWRLAAEWRD